VALICHCENVSDRSIGLAIHAGADSIDAITDACNAGGRCGGCHATLDTMLALLGSTGPAAEVAA
jgi:bacterioferritin-associated ferredoxin